MIVTRQMLLTVLLILVPFVTANAQESVPPDEEIRRYTVEIIIFKYAQDVSTGSEVFPPDEPPQAPLFGEVAADDENATVPADDEVPRRIRDIEFVALNRDEFTLSDTARRLELLEVYDPLMHFGWTQAAWPEEETLPIELRRFPGVPNDLDGRLTLYLGRYLHLVVDLTLDAPDAVAPAAVSRAPGSDYRDERLGINPAGPGAPGAVKYRINEDRILRSDELRYFDHPKFGVLAHVSRAEKDSD